MKDGAGYGSEGTKRVAKRVLLVDDQTLFAEGVSSVLQGQGVEVVGIAVSGKEALELARTQRPDTVLIDVVLPDMDGITAGKRILAERPGTKVLALTGLNDAGTIRRAIKGGFHGYLLKTSSLEALTASILATGHSQLVIPHGVDLARAASSSDPSDLRGLEPWAVPETGDDPSVVRASQITSRERQVLSLLAEGLGNGDIANRLYLSPNTVRTHIQNVLTKLQVHSRLEAVAFAVRHGIVRQPTRARGA